MSFLRDGALLETLDRDQDEVRRARAEDEPDLEKLENFEKCDCGGETPKEYSAAANLSAIFFPGAESERELRPWVRPVWPNCL